MQLKVQAWADGRGPDLDHSRVTGQSKDPSLPPLPRLGCGEGPGRGAWGATDVETAQGTRNGRRPTAGAAAQGTEPPQPSDRSTLF